MTVYRFTPFVWGFFILAIASLTISCTSADMDPEIHESYLQEWHNDRLDRLQSRQGWLSLAGMEWLTQGENTFGSHSSNDVIFPKGDMPEFAGILYRDGERVYVRFSEGVRMQTSEGATFDGGLLYEPAGTEVMLTKGSIDWVIIQRGELIGVRIYDTASPYRTHFTGLDRFPPNLDWRIKAKFLPHEQPVYLTVANVLGQVNELETPGVLQFQYEDEVYEIAVLPATNSFFLIIGDLTNRSSTYGGGRYLYTDLPNRRGEVIIDFNKMYNPPCALNPYSTCNLPPVQNRLQLAIEAGEKRYRIPESLEGSIRQHY